MTSVLMMPGGYRGCRPGNNANAHLHLETFRASLLERGNFEINDARTLLVNIPTIPLSRETDEEVP